MTVLLAWVSLWRRFDVVHVCLPTPSYVPFAALISRLPRALRPRVVLNVIDCTLAHNLTSGLAADRYEQQVMEAHRMYFRWVRLDGIYTWYQAFADLCHAQGLVARDTLVRAARFCFTDPQRFEPAAHKENVIVFAGRLSEQKRPWLFVEAVALLAKQFPDLVQNWRFEMYGGGVLEPRVRESIATFGLGEVISLAHTPDLAPVFARTRLFVSTQALENFTSLAMLEAMAAGNAVIAEDVGQTREFVEPGQNGLLVSVATAAAFAEAMAEYLRHPESHDQMAAASRARATTVHTIENFTADITAFWCEVASHRAP
jgi:glycosyltransferase involved in cell wall biosynthesis